MLYVLVCGKVTWMSICSTKNLCTDELNRQMTPGMSGLEFGPDEEVEKKLVSVLESEGYIRTVQHWERKHGPNEHGPPNTHNGRWGGFSNSWPSPSTVTERQSLFPQSRAIAGPDLDRDLSMILHGITGPRMSPI